MSAESLLAPEFLARLARLQLVSRRWAEARRRGRRRTRRGGAGVEAIDVRSYAAGDDLRRIDWNAYARFERLLVRVLAEESPLRLALVVDTSASMGFGAPSKLQRAKEIAAGLAAVALTAEDRAAAVTASSTPRLATRSSGGRKGLMRLLAALDELRPAGVTNLASAAQTATAGLGGRGLCVVLSDLLDPAGTLAGARALRMRGHEVAIVEVLTPFELEPPDLSGYDLEDAETGELLELPAAGALAAYREALAEHREALDREAAELGAPLLRASTDDALEDVITAGLRAGLLGGASLSGRAA